MRKKRASFFPNLLVGVVGGWFVCLPPYGRRKKARCAGGGGAKMRECGLYRSIPLQHTSLLCLCCIFSLSFPLIMLDGRKSNCRPTLASVSSHQRQRRQRWALPLMRALSLSLLSLHFSPSPFIRTYFFSYPSVPKSIDFFFVFTYLIDSFTFKIQKSRLKISLWKFDITIIRHNFYYLTKFVLMILRKYQHSVHIVFRVYELYNMKGKGKNDAS